MIESKFWLKVTADEERKDKSRYLKAAGEKRLKAAESFLVAESQHRFGKNHYDSMTNCRRTTTSTRTRSRISIFHVQGNTTLGHAIPDWYPPHIPADQTDWLPISPTDYLAWRETGLEGNLEYQTAMQENYPIYHAF